ncbi:leucine-rich repeat domain-containing protein [bacterium]|nr:leucine-rich repeat domain-containing protein [bacterium]
MRVKFSELSKIKKKVKIGWIGLLIAFFILAGGLLGQAHAAIPAIERAALIALYVSTDGDNWSNKTGWNGSPGTECGWFGVTCFGDTVTRLDLYNNNLTGNIPAELGNLTNLQFLFLYSNQLTSSIPVGLRNLTNLEDLSLYDNQLTGTIPTWIGDLVNLYDLGLGGNQLIGGIPVGLGKT